jgi:hypothetical protein
LKSSSISIGYRIVKREAIILRIGFRIPFLTEDNVLLKCAFVIYVNTAGICPACFESVIKDGEKKP